MLRTFLCLAMVLPSIQSGSPSFYVQVEAFSKYNAHYIFAYASEFFPPDEPVKEIDVPRKIHCLVNELKASGIYEDVEAEVNPSSREGIRWLYVRVIYCRNIKNLVISEILQEGFPEVNMEKFKSLLKENGIEPGIRFLKYNYAELTDKALNSLREAYPKELIQGDDDKRAWFIIRPAGYGKVKLTISSAIPTCVSAS